MNQAAQSISFPALPGTPFTSPPPTPGASASSGLAVSYTSNSTGVCTVTTGGAITFVSAGTCSLTAAQAGNANYAAATSVTQTFPITAGVNTISFPALPGTAFTSPPPTPGATASSGLAVSYTSNSTGVCTVTTGGAITFVSAGTCSLTAAQPGNANYAAATSVTQTFPITAGVNTISFPALPGTPFTSPPPTPGASASSGLAVSYTSNSTGVCTVTTGGAITFVSAGTCSLTAAQAGNANYAAATSVTQTFPITAGVNTISFPALPSTPFTSPPPTPGASASSGLAVSYTSNSTGVCTVTTGAPSPSSRRHLLADGGTGRQRQLCSGDLGDADVPDYGGRQHDLLPGAAGHTVHQPAADARRIGQLGSRGELHVELDRRVHGDDGRRHHLRLGGHLLADRGTARQRQLRRGDAADADVPDHGGRQHDHLPGAAEHPFTSAPPTPGARRARVSR